MLKVLDLFSGIGGFTLGLDSTGGFKTIAFVEKDKFCQKVLKKNFPNITIEGEIRDVKGDRYKADVITGGFPCQPFSVAGKRKGTDDDRYLWDETIRVIRECKPKWFIGENVEGLINIQEGMVLRQVQTDLEKEGFQVQCLIIPASGIGAWHQRKRVWIIGCNVSNSDKSRSFKKYSTSFNRQNKRDGSINESSSRSNENVSNSDNNGSHRQKRNATIKSSNEPKEWLSFGNDKDVSDSDKGLRRRWGAIGESGTDEVWGFYPKKEKQPKQNFRSKAIRCNDIFGEENVQDSNSFGLQRHRLQSNNLQKENTTREDGNTSFKEQQTWWQTQSDLCGVPNGISYELDKDRANRIKTLGNAIVPQIAREFGLAIKKVLSDEDII